MSKPLPTAPVVVLCRVGENPVVLCPHCKADALKGIDMGPDLNTVIVRCSKCGGLSAVTISEIDDSR
jgi:hypothetical protein